MGDNEGRIEKPRLSGRRALKAPMKICGNQKQPGSPIRHRQESGAVHWVSASCLATGGD